MVKKKHGENTDNPPMRIYVYKIQCRNIFKIKTEYHLKLLIPEGMKLLGSTENKITKDKNIENILHIEITEVVLVYYNNFNNDYQQDSRVLYTFVPNNSWQFTRNFSNKSYFLKII